jgi:hypothetical protein
VRERSRQKSREVTCLHGGNLKPRRFRRCFETRSATPFPGVRKGHRIPQPYEAIRQYWACQALEAGRQIFDGYLLSRRRARCAAIYLLCLRIAGLAGLSHCVHRQTREIRREAQRNEGFFSRLESGSGKRGITLLAKSSSWSTTASCPS